MPRAASGAWSSEAICAEVRWSLCWAQLFVMGRGPKRSGAAGAEKNSLGCSCAWPPLFLIRSASERSRRRPRSRNGSRRIMTRSLRSGFRSPKKGAGIASITAAQALDVCLCCGWIDVIRQGFDETSFLQRYVPRGKKSPWSQINREHVARLVAAGRMTPHGQKQVGAARTDERWAPPMLPRVR